MTQINNRAEPVDVKKPEKQPQKQKYFKLTFNELLNVLCTATIPIAIVIYTTITRDQQTQAARERSQFDLKQASELQQQQIYNRFIDDIYTLHRGGELNNTSRPWVFANARHRAAHLQWDVSRKAHALQFLKEKELIGRQQCETGCELKQFDDIIQLNGLNLDNVHLTSQTDTVNQLNMKCVQFEQVSMTNATFSFVNLNGASFNGSRLNGVKFEGSTLVCATFNGTELDGTDFGDSNLTNAQFVNVDLSTAKLTKSQRHQAKLENTIMSNTRVSDGTTHFLSTVDIPNTSVRNTTTNTLSISPCAIWNENGTTIAGNANDLEGSDLSSLKQPHGIFVDLDDNNTLYVADLGNKRILKFKQGEMIGQAVADNFTRPVSVFVDNDNNLYVADTGKVLKFRPNTSVGVTVAGGNDVGSGLYQLSNHTPGLMMDQDNNLYISEHENHRIVKWEPNAQTGILIAGKTNMTGNDSIRLNYPQTIFVDSIHNALYVVDQANSRIQRFHPIGNNSGETVSGSDTEGNSLFKLKNPIGIVVDSDENIYITDNGNDRIVKWMARNYTAGGVCIVGRCKSGGRQSNELRAPFDLKFDSDGNLIVSQTNSIQKFAIIRNRCD
ncbi:unnamed protein product [Didymodactylos carnosus]|uniref:Uncharacterized protein n=1 Tax=Didymodactylos carnosus TaxID=1234261 RepID=A0A8S2JQN2_9BILA|nr:unnamed protein product [Didymodactylos carnosus]CAF3817734.1 unnamed protein product [Didymodactylos carnosus]